MKFYSNKKLICIRHVENSYLHYTMNYFDLDVSFSDMTPEEEMTYCSIQNIINDEKNGWTNETYREHDIQKTSYDIPIVKLTDAINALQEKATAQEKYIEGLKMRNPTANSEKDLQDARITMVEQLDLLDLHNKTLEDYILNACLEKLRLNHMHAISYRYKITGDKDMLVTKTKALMNYIVANQVTCQKVPLF